MKKTFFLFNILLIISLCSGCENIPSELSSEQKAEVPVTISVQRTGNIVSGIGGVSVYIDNEEVFKVNNNKTESVEIIMTEGIHTIQTKGQGDKSKKVKFEVIENGENEFFFTTEIGNWWGVKLEAKKYIPINQ